ncbi:GlsB/YeaQ/YmgE family stress response membrane protein [Azospirillum sp. B2RO_4]|uniref:GlsB/YeaQ/YmgE family stress response membrane protein n=1 Tax=Azospirillum sp. B2RO_4 TaxID=3027796 RepID=UPI003DA85478
MGIIAWIILGLIAGFIASKIVNNSGQGIVMDIVLGIVGALVGGFLVSIVGGAGITGFNIWSILVAIFGAVVVLWIYHAVAGRRTVG